MTLYNIRWARGLALLLVVALVAACGLPRSGPNKREIYAGSVQKEGDAFVLTVNDWVTRATAVQPALGFSAALQNASQIGADTIRPGDTLGLTFFENVKDGILTSEGAPAALEEVQVDSSGMIFVPYAGRIKASGNTPEALRRVITRKLDEQTPDPQVMVRRLAGNGATVSIVGGIGAPGIHPIERPTRTLTGMIAAAGGVSIEPEIAKVSLLRGGQTGTVWLEDLYQNPSLDIALRGNDRIVVEADTRAFTALGATGSQSRVQFETQTLSALEAIAQVGGLKTNVADPTGVFILRNEDEKISNNVLGRNDLTGPQRMIYILDLTEPNGMFMARDFVIRDGDTLYVTEAPFVQWNKTLAALTGSLGNLNTIEDLTTGN